MNELIPLEKEIVKSAHGDGMIPFPQGSFLAVERTFRMLDDLARRGYVEYVAKTWYRAYWITEKGWRIVRRGQKLRREMPAHISKSGASRVTDSTIMITSLRLAVMADE